MTNIPNGQSAGNFGWLSWAGSPNETNLVNSLQVPGNSFAFVNPDDSADHQISLGDWVQAKPGVSNSKNVRDALDVLKNIDITVPVWGQTRGQGEKAAYQITNFARIRLISYQLPHQNRLTFRFLSYATCDRQNLPPTVNAGPDQTITLPNTAVLHGTASDDGLPTGSTLVTTWAALSGPGSVTFSDPHVLTTTATFGAEGTYLLRLTATDTQFTTSDDVVITVNRPNSPPESLPQTVTTDEDTAINITLQGSDPDSDPVTFVVTTLPAYGTLSGSAPNLVYTPNADYNGTDTFTFKTSDGYLDSASATVTINIRPVNDAPIAQSESITNAEDTAIPITLNASDLEGSPLQYILLTSPTNGTLTGIAPFLTYTPTTNYFGYDSFTFKVNDGEVDSLPATVRITVTPVNDPPMVDAGPDELISLPTNSVTLVGLITDDLFPGAPADTIQWSQLSGPTPVEFAEPSNAITQVTFSAPGIYELQLTASDSFLTASDNVVITVNQPPQVHAGTNQTITFPASAVLNAEVSDDGLPVDGSLSLFWSQVSGPGAVVFSDLTSSNTTAAFSEGGVYVLRLTAGDSITSTSDDVTVTVNRAPMVDAGSDQLITNLTTVLTGTVFDDALPVNDLSATWTKVSGPGDVVFATNAATTIASFTQTGIYQLRLTANDSLAETFDEMTVTINAAPVVGAGSDQKINFPGSVNLTGSVTDDGLPANSLSMQWSQVSGPGLVNFSDANAVSTSAGFTQAGSYLLRLTASDTLSTTSSDLTIIVNQPPVAIPQGLVTPEDTPLTLSLGAADLENSPLSFTIIELPGHGQLIGSPPDLTYIPATNFSGTDSFTFKVNDGDADSAPATVSIIVTAINDAPIASSQTLATDEDTQLDVVLSGSDVEGAFLSFAIVTGPLHGTLTGTPPNVTYTPSANYNGADSFSFKVNDGELDSAPATVSITVRPINDPPVVNAGTNQLVSWPTNSVDLSGTVSDDGDPAGGVLISSWSLVSGPGQVTFDDTNAPQTAATFSAPGIYVLQLSASDSLVTASNEVTITINRGPVVDAGSDQVVLLTDAVTFNGTVNDDGIPSDVPLSVEWTVVSGPGQAVMLNPHSARTAAQFTEAGTYVLRLSASDSLVSASDEMTVFVLKPNAPPQVSAGQNQLVLLSETATLRGNVSDDGIPAAAPISSIWSKLSGPGSVTFADASATNTTAVFSEAGNYVLRLTANDTALTNYSDVTILVRTPAMNEAPVVNAGSDLVIGLTNVAQLSGVVTDDGLPRGASISVVWSKIAGPGTVLFDDSTLTNARASFSQIGTYTLRLTASDTDLTNSDELTVTVYPFNQPPDVDAGPDQQITIPDPAVLASNGIDATNLSTYLSRSLIAAEKWDNSLGQPGITGLAAGSSLVWVRRNGLNTDSGNLYVSGAFTNADGLFAKSLAKFDGTNWSAFYDPRPVPRPGGIMGTNIGFLVPECGTMEFCDEIFDTVAARGSELFVSGGFKDIEAVSDGRMDMTDRWSGTGWESWGFKNAGNEVISIKATTNLVYLVGHFAFQPTNVTAQTLTNLPWSYNIATWDGTNWGVLGSGITDIRDTVNPGVPGLSNYNGYVTAVALSPSGDVYAGGQFFMSTALGQANNIAKWNGTRWEPLGTGLVGNGINFTVNAMAFADDGELIVGGNFTSAGGVSARNLARWNGSQWKTMGAGTTNGASGSVEAIVVRGRDVYVAGSFTEAGGVSTARIAKWNHSTWSALGSGSTNGVFGTGVFALAVDDSAVYVGGSFSAAGGLAATNLAKWALPTPSARGTTLAGHVSDDGLPTGSSLSLTWTKVSGPGTVTFSDPHAANSTAYFSQLGTYVLRLTASDSDLTGLDEVAIQVTGNRPPTVDAGPDQAIGLSESAVLAGAVTDDGFPVGADVSHVWSMVSGPGTATFTSVNDTNATVRFSAQGTYVLRLTANDSQFTTFDDVLVTVASDNSAPTGNAGSSRTILLTTNTVLSTANISDDGKPLHVTNILWTQFSGPGIVSFSNPTNQSTTATFSAPGVYVVRLLINDSQLVSFSDVTITVNMGNNAAPVVNAGPDQSLSARSNLFAVLKGTVTDDGLPEGAQLKATWSMVNGPTGGAVTFVDSNSPVTGVSFSKAGLYQFQLTASDSVLSANKSMIVNFTNTPPVVDAGPDRTITMPTTNLLLTGTVTDDGLPTPPSLFISWSKVSGPGTVTFTNASILTNTVKFSTNGTYVLRLLVNDGQFNVTDDVAITVAPPGNQPPTVNAGADVSIAWPATNLALSGTIADDGLPTGSTPSVLWSKISGPGNVSFVNPALTNTTATFSTTGTYVLRLTGTDSALTNADDVIVQVRGASNQPPVVSLGTNPTVRLPNTIALTGTVTDDGLPLDGGLNVYWQKVSGPAPVYFTGATNLTTNLNTTVSFAASGTYLLRLTAMDSELKSSADLTVTVLPLDSNQPPTVFAGPDTSATTFVPFTLRGSVTDDGLPTNGFIAAAWSRVSGPGTVYFSNANATNTTAMFYVAGSYVLRLTATDGRATSFDDIAINAVPATNEPPIAYAGPALTVVRPNAAELEAAVFDDGLPVGYPVTFAWTKVSGPGDVTFVPASGNVTNSLVDTFATFSAEGTYVLRLSGTDSQYTNTDDVTITVLAGTNAPPMVNAGPDQSVALQQPAVLHTEASDDGLEEGLLEVWWSKLSGPGAVAFSTVNGIYRASFTQPGQYILRLYASDYELTNYDDVTITVYDAAAAPDISIASPLDAAIITAPTVVTGIVSSVVLQSYQLQYRLKPADTLNSQPSTLNWTTLASGNSSIINNALGTFDPTMLLNGIYELQLTATDILGRTSTTEPITLVVDRRLKVGNFTVSFSDLKVPVSGLPIEIVRTYDSRAAAAGIQGDFGLGWTLDIRNVRVQKNRSFAFNWQAEGGASSGFNYCLDPFRPRVVTLTFPDGQTHKFEAHTSPECQFGYPISAATVVYRPLDNTRGTLVSLGPDGDEVLVDADSGSVNFFDYHGNYYDPTRFQFTSDEGDISILDQNDGLQSRTDRSGNSLLVSSNGVTWTNAVAGGPGLSIVFTRDDTGRITQITDPAGQVLRYAYDTNGNLIAFTDRITNATAFAYTNAAFPHYLTEITDPRGVKAIRTEFDASGRMVRQIDASGRTNSFTHDIAAHHEIVTDRLGNVTVHEYDDNGNVTRTTDALGNVTSHAYDANDNELFTTNASGHVTSFTYDSHFNKLSETDPLGFTTRYSYDSFRQVTSITDARGNVTTNSYDESGNLTQQVDALGNVTAYSFDSRGNLLTRTDALGNVISNRYDSLGRLTNMMTIDAQCGVLNESAFSYDANGNQLSKQTKRTTASGVETLLTRHEYDQENRLTLTIHPDGSTNATLYAVGLDKPYVEIDPLGTRTQHFYDERGNETNTVFADLTSESFVFDAENRKVATIDRAGRLTSYNFDGLGRMTNSVLADGSTTNTVYDAIGRIIAATDERGNTTRFEYDPNCGCSGRKANIIDALGNITHFDYDENANETAMTDALGRTTQYVYDALDRRTRINFVDGTHQITTYDALGRRIAETDQAGQTTRYGYDALSRLTSVTNALSGVTAYSYDETGGLVTQTDANNHTTTFVYDSMGRRTKRTLPAGQFETYSYDKSGNLTNKVDFNGRTTRYSYDAMNRLLTKTPDAFFGAPPVAFTYTATGQRASMSDSSGLTTYLYNERDWLTNKATPQGTISYTRDAHGNVSRIKSSNANGTDVAYGYDALNRVAGVLDAKVGTTSYSYDAAGNLTNCVYPNNVASVYRFDSLNRLTNLASTHPVVGTLASYAYTVGPTGNRITANENVALSAQPSSLNRIYGYDNLYRLTAETISGTLNGSVGYTHDSVGNRLTRNSTLGAIPSATYSYDADDRLTGDIYDANGNTTLARVTANSPIVSDSYDFEDHLVARQSPGGNIQIVYDGEGNRVRETVNGVTTIYVMDDQNPTGYAQVLEELSTVNSQLSTVRVYAYGLVLISEDQLVSNVWKTSFYGYDGHGNSRYLTDLSGNSTDAYVYDAFGSLIASSGGTPNSYLYCGEPFDSELSLYYNRARYLNVDSGRFWTRDELRVYRKRKSTFHNYLFGNANPVTWIDPTGHNSTEEEIEVVHEEELLGKSGAQRLVARGQKIACKVAKFAGQLHHIATNKDKDWAPLFEDIFDNAEMFPNDEFNLIFVLAHFGPHPEAYHAEVYETLTAETKGLKPFTEQYTRAVEKALDKLASRVNTVGDKLNDLITKSCK